MFTIIPYEVVFYREDEPQLICLIEYGGIKMEAIDSAEGYKIMRLLDTDPSCFLNPKFQPGSLIMKSNEVKLL